MWRFQHWNWQWDELTLEELGQQMKGDGSSLTTGRHRFKIPTLRWRNGLQIRGQFMPQGPKCQWRSGPRLYGHNSGIHPSLTARRVTEVLVRRHPFKTRIAVKLRKLQSSKQGLSDWHPMIQNEWWRAKQPGCQGTKGYRDPARRPERKKLTRVLPATQAGWCRSGAAPICRRLLVGHRWKRQGFGRAIQMPRRKPEGVGASVEASVILRNGLEPRDPEKNKHCILKCSVAWCTWTCQSETPKTFINGRTNPTYVHQLRFVWWCLKHLTWGRDSCASWVSCLGVASDTETATFVIHDMVRSSHRLVFSHHFCLSCLYLFMMWYDVFPTGDEKKTLQSHPQIGKKERAIPARNRISVRENAWIVWVCEGFVWFCNFSLIHFYLDGIF